MKLVHLSDIHIADVSLFGLDPIEHFQLALAHLREFHADAERIVITGDLTHEGSATCYVRLRVLLENSGLLGTQVLKLLLGNHDNREAFKSVFPEAPCDEHGFLQAVDVTPVGWFVYLDTVEAGQHTGVYCPLRYAWLSDVLRKAVEQNQPVWLFMHHNPTPVHVGFADSIGLLDGARFRELLSDYRTTIRHVFFGHCHFSLSGSIAGIPISAPAPTSHPSWPNFETSADAVLANPAMCSYNVCFIDGDSVVVHRIDYMSQGDVHYLEVD